MKIVDRIIDRLLTKALERRYTVSPDHRLVYMTAERPMTEADKAIMRAIAAELNAPNWHRNLKAHA